MSSSEISGKVEAQFGDRVSNRIDFRGETSLTVSADAIHDVAQFCRDELGFNYLVDISSVDHFDTDPRWEVVYELYALESGVHLRLKVPLTEDEAEVATVSDLWPTADWHEREVFDMMGITFTGHGDLRRILMWEGYPYHPLRKDFPLEGKPSEMPDIAFSDVAPLAGGPFVTAPTSGNTQVREPRARHAGELPPKQDFIAEP